MLILSFKMNEHKTSFRCIFTKEAVIKTIEILESRLELVKKEIKTNKIKNLTKRQLCYKVLRMKYSTDLT